jgi:hypothetical protein
MLTRTLPQSSSQEVLSQTRLKVITFHIYLLHSKGFLIHDYKALGKIGIVL